jgi:hypothetical protein
VSAASLARRLATIALVAGAASALAGCGPDYDHTDLAIGKAPPKPLDGRVDYARIQVSVGAVVTAHLVSYDDDHKEMATDLRSKDPSVVEVAGVVSPGDYAFLGLRPGSTEIEVRADGHLVVVLKAVVTEQPPLP